jgi:hypothetical protein
MESVRELTRSVNLDDVSAIQQAISRRVCRMSGYGISAAEGWRALFFDNANPLLDPQRTSDPADHGVLA